MDYIRFAISNPVKVAVGAILLVLFGLIALFTIPIQLVPNVDQPIITITTEWSGRSPEEVEREIVEEQEDKVKGVANLRKMTGKSELGRATITLEFFVGTDMTRSLQEVSDKLREVPEYPDDADQPVVAVADSASENAIAWMILASDDPDFDVQSLFNEVDKRVKPYLERVPGLAEVNIYGGRDREVHIQIDPKKMADRGITFNMFRDALRLENVNVSAGDMAEGRLDVRIRTVGQYDNVDDIRETIVTYAADGGPVRIKDIGDAVLTLEKRRSFVHSKGKNSIAINGIRESGANVVEVMAGLQKRIADVKRDILPTLGPKLKLEQVYDETVYIYDAIALVRDNLWQGGVLTILVLLFFLRHTRHPLYVMIAVPVMIGGVIVAMMAPTPTVQNVALGVVGASLLSVLAMSPPTAIIALAIPLSVIGTFVALTGMGRNLNVISLAGLAFAIGMVVDNAIVVLENTDRHLSMGKSPARAAYDATREVFAAVIASTLTTLVVFLPVLTIEEEAGQLFLDISLAICVSVFLSLVVAVTVIPSAASRWLHQKDTPDTRCGRVLDSFFGLAPLLTRLVNGVAGLIYWLTGSIVARVGVVALFTVVSLVGSYLLMPPTDYLPKGNRNLVFGFMIKPPAYNIAQNEFIGERIESVIAPYWEARSYDDTKKLGPVIDPFGGPVHDPIPPIDNFFFVSFGDNIFMGAASTDKQNVAPLAPLIRSTTAVVPSAFVVAQQMSLFGRGLGGTRSIDVELAGSQLDQVRGAASSLKMALAGKYGFGSIQPDPLNFDLAGPELQVKIDRVRAADLGIDVAALGLGVQSLVDGAVIGDYRYQGDSIDLLMVRDPGYPLTPDTLAQVPIAVNTREGSTIIPLASIATITNTTAPQQIKRIEQLRAVSLTVVPPDTVPLEQAMNDINGMIAGMRASGQIPQTVETTLAGTADKLTRIRESFLGQWHGLSLRTLQSLIMSRMFLALLVCYLVMAAVFESFLYPFVIMFSVPLATIGGFLGLRLVHTFEPTQMLDVVTMLGFVILIGTVVNNAILIVAQSLNYMKGVGESDQDVLEKAMSPREAIRESVRTRMRPVMMTTITTLFGMLPLVIKPGSGSELYRGLGAVVLGGLLCSTLFTLIVVPLMFSLVFDLKVWFSRLMGWPVAELRPATAPIARSPMPSARHEVKSTREHTSVA